MLKLTASVAAPQRTIVARFVLALSLLVSSAQSVAPTQAVILTEPRNTEQTQQAELLLTPTPTAMTDHSQVAAATITPESVPLVEASPSGVTPTPDGVSAPLVLTPPITATSEVNSSSTTDITEAPPTLRLFESRFEHGYNWISPDLEHEEAKKKRVFVLRFFVFLFCQATL
jgi:hypothetical protein